MVGVLHKSYLPKFRRFCIQQVLSCDVMAPLPLICKICGVVKPTRQAIKKFVKYHKRCVKIMVPLDVVKRIIGKSSEIIMSIRKETRTKLQFMPEIQGIGDCGQKAKVEKAKELVVKASLYTSLYISMDSFLVPSLAPLVQSPESHGSSETLKATAEDVPLFIAPVACPSVHPLLLHSYQKPVKALILILTCPSTCWRKAGESAGAKAEVATTTST